MRFDVSGEVQGEWFKFFRSEIKEGGEVVYLDSEPDAGRVRIRIADAGAIDQIRVQTRKVVKEFVLNTRSKAMERVEYEDQTPEQKRKEGELIWDHAIQGWEGILDKDGNEIPCTTENKVKLMGIPQFARFVGRCLQIITGANAGMAEDEAKNS
jgi:hypothetical protein